MNRYHILLIPVLTLSIALFCFGVAVGEKLANADWVYTYHHVLAQWHAHSWGARGGYFLFLTVVTFMLTGMIWFVLDTRRMP